MTAKSTNIRIDENLKKESQELFASLGLDMTTAINIFLRQSVKEQAIPFRVGEPTPNYWTRKAIEDVKNGIGLSKAYSSVEELMGDLDAGD